MGAIQNEIIKKLTPFHIVGTNQRIFTESMSNAQIYKLERDRCINAINNASACQFPYSGLVWHISLETMVVVAIMVNRTLEEIAISVETLSPYKVRRDKGIIITLAKKANFLKEFCHSYTKDYKIRENYEQLSGEIGKNVKKFSVKLGKIVENQSMLDYTNGKPIPSPKSLDRFLHQCKKLWYTTNYSESEQMIEICAEIMAIFGAADESLVSIKETVERNKTMVENERTRVFVDRCIVITGPVSTLGAVILISNPVGLGVAFFAGSVALGKGAMNMWDKDRR